ncbi:MAG: shikimate kinase [Brooklawnia sp.]|jgi:shikimate kinase
MFEGGSKGSAPIVLIGLPAVGKSTVGAIVARRLGLRFVDVDALIETQAGRPITEIFATDGEAGFRALELAATVSALTDGGVIALGGGAVTNPALRQALAGHRVLWLRASERVAVQRVGHSDIRPLLRGDVAGKWRALAAAREPLYAQVATLVIETDGRTPGQVAQQVIAQLEGDK